MNPTPLLRIIILLCALFIPGIAAQAQVRYAFVSMTGSDANNCISATTACRTLQRAHDVVNDGGSVVVRDSGGYGPTTITKSVTISGEGALAGLTAVGLDAVAININTPGVVVRLRYLNITGLNTNGNSDGIRYTDGEALHIEHCVITGFSSQGLRMNTVGRLYISDSTFRNNGTGIRIAPSTSPCPCTFGTINILRTLIEQNVKDGLAAVGGRTNIMFSRIAGNGDDGLFVDGLGVEAYVQDSQLSNNNSNGIRSKDGAVILVADSAIIGNGRGVSAGPGSLVLSRLPQSNTLEGNAINGSFSGTYSAQ